MILVDVDGVIADLQSTAEEVFDRIQSKHDGQCLGLDFTRYDFLHQADAKYRERFWAAYDKSYGWDYMPPLPGLYDCHNDLISRDVVFVSQPPPNRPQNWYHIRRNWLNYYGLTGKLVMTSGPESRAMVPGDYLLDDNPDNLEAWAEANPYGLPILIAAPYNKCNDDGFPYGNEKGPWQRMSLLEAFKLIRGKL